MSKVYDPTITGIVGEITNRSTKANNFTVSDTTGTILVENKNRVAYTIQNVGVVPLYVKWGISGSNTSFNYILSSGNGYNDGKGGYILHDTIWKGDVSVSGTTPRYVYSELT